MADILQNLKTFLKSEVTLLQIVIDVLTKFIVVLIFSVFEVE
jgi:hypothetical protein